MKHLFSSWAISLFALFIIVPNSFAAKWKAEHVVLIGLDGWGAYSVEKADIPNTKSLMENGSYTLKKRSTLPSSSAINWASMFMGAGPELHGYTECSGTSLTRIEPARYFPYRFSSTAGCCSESRDWLPVRMERH